jgi:hypothetical protein
MSAAKVGSSRAEVGLLRLLTLVRLIGRSLRVRFSALRMQTGSAKTEPPMDKYYTAITTTSVRYPSPLTA